MNNIKIMEAIKERRQRFNQLGNNYQKAASVNIEQAFINGVNCYWFIPQNEVSKKIIIYLHGGAFAVGSIHSHQSMVSHFSEKLQTRILFIDYPLAPENTFPAAINDIRKVYLEIITEYPDHKVSFIGDSAGGGLIVSLMGELLKLHLQLPQAAILISPWISLACDNASHEENRQLDPILTREYAKASAADYAGNETIETVSPENVELNEFPPVLIMVGTNEILLDDSKNFYNYIKNIQHNAVLTIYDHQNHVWPLANIHSEASRNALTQINDFLNELQ